MGIKVSKAEKSRRQLHFDSWYGSGKSMRAYSQQAGLNYNSFKQWCSVWRKAQGIELLDQRTKGSFVLVAVVSSPSVKTTPPLPIPSNGVYRFELKLLFGLLHYRIG
tara:strand:+ start:598 stop:918 length:321 start_codon:yes stop_codon:yes gene_type:complete